MLGIDIISILIQMIQPTSRKPTHSYVSFSGSGRKNPHFVLSDP